MKRHLRYLCAVAAILVAGTACAANYSNEVLHYQVVYHWGVIWKHAADATLSIKNSGSGYNAMLTGKTRSWADKVYPVRDTLKCSMNSNMAPLKYEKITHEKDYYARDLIKFSYNYSHTSAACTRYRKSGTQTASLSAKCQAYDMVSVFYMLRNQDYDAFSRNKSMTTVIFSGKKKEYLTIRYVGKENIKMRNGSTRQAHHITFKFTQEGSKKSGDDINAWMSADAQRIPLLLVGKLPVGEVKCYCTN
ncbi:MAG: DUF3108 domain-containing protein [Bacteroidales bacterium]|nr:DUF3108 domain-containing protein [Candidatus Sodaliphilus aphodohippi]